MMGVRRAQLGLVAALLLGGAVAPVARAVSGANPCHDTHPGSGSQVVHLVPHGPPPNADGSPAYEPGICVYLPPGYATSRLRYPVVYLLHGLNGDETSWFHEGGAQAVFDAAYRANHRNAVIAVAPNGGDVGYWADNHSQSPAPVNTVFDAAGLGAGNYQNETYFFDDVVPYVDHTFRTIPDRRARAIAGLSDGGVGALRLGSLHPDWFTSIGALSPAFSGLTSPQDVGYSSAAAAYEIGTNPSNLVPNIDAVDLHVIWAAYCGFTADSCAANAGAYATEQVFVSDARQYHEMLATQRRTPYVYIETEGGHQWSDWTVWLADEVLPSFLARFPGPIGMKDQVVPSAPPDTFRFRSVNSHFSVYGYDVSVQRANTEMLQLDDVTATGLIVTGSGLATIVTAPRYVPGARYTVAGSSDDGAVIADRAGRLTFDVDLGPSHMLDFGFPPPAAPAPGYWTTRTVTLTRAR